VRKSPEDADTQAAFRQQFKKAMTEHESSAKELSKILEEAGASYNATFTGYGTIAQRQGAKAVGQGGVLIGGNVSGSIVADSSSEHSSPFEGRPK
jgi:hypothetical protein